MTEEERKKALENFNALIEEARKNNVNMTMDEINEEIRLARAERKHRENRVDVGDYSPSTSHCTVRTGLVYGATYI